MNVINKLINTTSIQSYLSSIRSFKSIDKNNALIGITSGVLLGFGLMTANLVAKKFLVKAGVEPVKSFASEALDNLECPEEVKEVIKGIERVSALPFGVLILCYAPIAEELKFRQGMLGLIPDESTLQSLVRQAFLFSIAHKQGLHFLVGSIEKATIQKKDISRFTRYHTTLFIAGLTFGLLYKKTGDIRVSMLAHLVYNVISVAFKNLSMDPFTIGVPINNRVEEIE